MLRVLGVVTAGSAVLLAAAPARADLTPDGAASLINRDLRPRTLALVPPTVLTGLQVTVGEGGRAGTVRVLAASALGDAPFEPVKAGPPETLPAQPGTYTLAAPRVHAHDFYRTQLGLQQETGGHEIVGALACEPAQPVGIDPCTTMFVDGWPGGDRAGALLAIQGVYEPDRDRDLRGDKTEDRTDLRVRATTTRGADRLQRTTMVDSGKPPVALTLAVDGKPSLRRGIKVRLTSGGPTRVTAAFAVRGRTIRLARDLRLAGSRTVTLRATGAKLRSLQRAAKGKSLRATITVRGGGGASATTTARVAR